MKSGFLVLLVYCVVLVPGVAQESVIAAGGEALGQGSVSYSVGQIRNHTLSDTAKSVSEGVQQPYEISEVLQVDKYKSDVIINVFPNPLTDFINLNIESGKFKNSVIELYDAQGKLILSTEVTQKENQISMLQFPKANYVLRFQDDKGKNVSWLITKK